MDKQHVHIGILSFLVFVLYSVVTEFFIKFLAIYFHNTSFGKGLAYITE